MYNPYSNAGDAHQVNGHHAQQQQQQQQSQQQPFQQVPTHNPQFQAGGNPQLNVPFNNVFSDPRATMGLQFSQSAINAGQQYMQNNFSTIMHGQNIKTYFKVSNSYVWHKLYLILLPYRNKTWARVYRTSTDQNNNSIDVFAPPLEDVNAPDLYIPVMGYVTYILLWAIFSGIKGSFHPELLGYTATRILALGVLDVLFLKIALYTLSVESKFWDVVAYSGYKFVSVLVIMLFKNIFQGSKVVYYLFSVGVLFSLGFFLMRSLRYVLLPSGGNSVVSHGQKKMRTNFLFLYSFPIQLFLAWLMI